MRLSWALRRPKKRPGCARCHTSWRLVRPHVTKIDRTLGIFVICRKCWREVKREGDRHVMLSWYREATAVRSHLISWGRVAFAVTKELRKG